MQQSSSDIRHAAYLTAHEFPPVGGLNSMESAAVVLGRATGTVYNKVDPGTDQGLYLQEALQLVLASKDYRILHAFAAACGHVAVQLAPFGPCSDVELLDLFIAAAKAAGDRAKTIGRALADGRIDREEIKQIRAAFYAEFRAQQELLSRLEAITDDAR